jgi:ppGpp synthetase/RelA/SpoT-type nucleotidyltranferase
MNADYAIRDEYVSRFNDLSVTAEKLCTYLRGITSQIPRIDSITSRAKSPDRYFNKALKLDADGNRKYAQPKYGIQDQIGARINVLYVSDIEIVRSELVRFMKFIEDTPKSPDDESAFGYFGHHFIFQMPEDVVDDERKSSIPEFFELQIKTLFQHAWSETNHDLGYKTIRKLTPDERRRIAFTAAQAWGADKIFDELAKTLALNDNAPADRA